MRVEYSLLIAALSLVAFPAVAVDAGTPRTVDAGKTGFDVKRPVLACACEHGCPWGELGDFVKEAMQPLGYDVVLCRNCNRDQGPRIVSTAAYPPELGIADTFVGTTTRVNAPIDFGITSSGFLAWAYFGRQGQGPYDNLRLVARIEDPSYLLVAVKADSGITDLSQIAERKMPVTILGGGSPISQPVLDYYGITQDAVASWGGVFHDAITFGQAADPEFDVIINENASPANNPESSYWTKVSQKHDLRFFDLPESVLDKLANDETVGVVRATAKWGLLRGVDHPISTVARTGHAVFARSDMPDQAAYDAAKAIDEHRSALKWFIRPYSYDTKTVWQNQNVPLHPGAEKYYREVGYLKDAASAAPCSAPTAQATGGCSFSSRAPQSSDRILSLALGLALAVLRRRQSNGSDAVHSPPLSRRGRRGSIRRSGGGRLRFGI